MYSAYRISTQRVTVVGETFSACAKSVSRASRRARAACQRATAQCALREHAKNPSRVLESVGGVLHASTVGLRGGGCRTRFRKPPPVHQTGQGLQCCDALHVHQFTNRKRVQAPNEITSRRRITSSAKGVHTRTACDQHRLAFIAAVKCRASVVLPAWRAPVSIIKLWPRSQRTCAVNTRSTRGQNAKPRK